MAEEISIRNGKPEDSSFILSCLNKDCMLASYEGEPPTSLEEVDKILLDIDSNLVLIAEKSGQITGFVLGCVYPEDKKAYLSTLYVVPEHRKNGIAKGLERGFEKTATERGCRSITVLVNESNVNMKKLLAKTGWAKGYDFDCFYKELGEQQRH